MSVNDILNIQSIIALKEAERRSKWLDRIIEENRQQVIANKYEGKVIERKGGIGTSE